MKLKHLPYCLALSAGLFSGQQALAGDLLYWQDNSLSYLYGENFQRMNFNGEEQRTQTTFTFEHASGWAWGDIFYFLDYIRADTVQTRGSFDNSSFRQHDKDSFYYMEFSPRVSLSWLTRQKQPPARSRTSSLPSPTRKAKAAQARRTTCTVLAWTGKRPASPTSRPTCIR